MAGSSTGTLALVALIVVALGFDFVNGFHDSANSVATVVSTRVLKPGWAVAWTAFFNFVAFLVFPLKVAHTIGSGIVGPALIDDRFVLATLVGAIGWDLITWWRGLPSSSSHALVGGLVGAGIAKAGLSAVTWKGLMPTLVFIVVSPAIGLALAVLLVTIVSWTLRNVALGKVNEHFKKLQLLSAALLSLGHGGNDAQKTMGIITALLIAHHRLGEKAGVPLWVVLACHAAIALGTLSGGWRIIKTMGMGLTEMRPFQGFCAETGGALSLFLATSLGIPVSTTHVITGGIVGVGAAAHPGAVRWTVASRIVWAWVFTVPLAALFAGAALMLFRLLNFL